MTSPESTANDDLAALESFVVDNDDLLELEALIGRFNIFDSLRIVDAEIRHSNFLAWLLDPAESHGQGGLFLRAILMDLLKSARENGFACPVSPVELDGEELHGVEIRREWKQIDILITCDQPQFVIAIENKVNSSEHGNQLSRYRKVLDADFSNEPSMCVFLTVDGDEASEDDWVPYSYGDLHRVLTRVRKANDASIGDDVLAFLDHYLRLIKGRLMDDPKIEELCQRIYKHHRQAIDLIVENVGSPEGRVIAIARQVLDEDDRVRYLRGGKKAACFVPKDWQGLLPSIGSGQGSATTPDCWVDLLLVARKNTLRLRSTVRATLDQQFRMDVIARLTESPREFGFRLVGKKLKSSRMTRIGNELVFKWGQDEYPEPDEIREKVSDAVNKTLEKTAGVPDALRPIVEEWERKNQDSD